MSCTIEQESSVVTIGKLAELVQTSTDALRHYERLGLIAPDRSRSGYRLFDKDCILRAHFIKEAQNCGLTLAEIRELLVLRERGTACCEEVRGLIQKKKFEIEIKIRRMKQISTMLDRLIMNCPGGDEAVTNCTIMRGLGNAGSAITKC